MVYLLKALIARNVQPWSKSYVKDEYQTSRYGRLREASHAQGRAIDQLTSSDISRVRKPGYITLPYYFGKTSICTPQLVVGRASSTRICLAN